jgi:uncharacterized protein
MARLPSRFRRLDQILADLPIDDPMLLTELDGYLTGLAVAPELPPLGEWLPPIWGGQYGERAPFADAIDVQLFEDMVVARRNEIVRDLARHKLQPIFDVDERNGEVIWEEWAQGFSMAMQLRPDQWSATADGDNSEAAEALSYLLTLASIASDTSPLTSVEINTICDDAVGMIPTQVMRLHTVHEQPPAVLASDVRAAKIGRNEACPCGSGKKRKRCCSSN